MLFFASVAHGEIREFVKEDEVTVPDNQSFEQVVEYTTKRMAREATEEAGVFISTLSSVKNGRLDKDEVATVAGSIAQIKVDKRERVLKNETIFAKVRVRVQVDTDTVASYLKKIVENEEYKKEMDALRKRNLELENRLKNANKEEFDKKLSAEAELLASEQKKRYLEIRGVEEKAKAEYLEAERRRMDEEIKTREQLAALKRQFAEEEAKARARINAAQNSITKAELENSAKIEELERNARENKASWLALSDITAEAAEKEAAEVRLKIAYLKKEFKEKLDSNAKRLEKVYNDEIASVESRKFTEPVPVKGEWDTTEEYNKLKSAYDKRKKDFETSKNSTLDDLKLKKELALQDMRLSGEEIMQNSIAPLLDRLKEHSAGRYVSIKEEYAAISFGEKDVDNKKLPFTLKYGGKSYNFDYIFENIPMFRAMYETRGRFYAVPTFGIEPSGTGARKFLSGFTVMHLGNDKKTWFKAAAGQSFPEVPLATEGPVIKGAVKKVISVGSLAYAETADGKRYIWGNVGELAIGDNEYIAKPKRVSFAIKNIIGNSFTTHYILTDRGLLYAWGNNDCGQIGNGTTDKVTAPTKVKLLSNVKEAFTNGSTVYAITDTGLYAWGYNREGQIGNGSADKATLPASVNLAGKIKKIIVGSFTVYATTDTGLYAWGYNKYGQVGNGTTDKVTAPTRVRLSDNVKEVFTNGLTVYAITDTGLYAWGDKVTIPTKVKVSGNVKKIIFADFRTYAITDVGLYEVGNGTIREVARPITNKGLYAWGKNDYGQKSNGTAGWQGTIPTKVKLSGNVKEVISDGSTVFAITDTGLYAWGDNEYGQVGNGTSGGRVILPTKVEISGNVKEVITNDSTIYAITDVGFYAWGYNRYGQIGNGTTDERVTTPTKIKLSGNVKEVISDGFTVYAITDDGLYAWGDNSKGQIGNGTVGGNVLKPVKINFPSK